MAIVNMTFEIKDGELTACENWMRYTLDKVISFKTIPDTSNMYKNNTHFKKMVDVIKKLQVERDKYINDNHYKYRDDIQNEPT